MTSPRTAFPAQNTQNSFGSVPGIGSGSEGASLAELRARRPHQAPLPARPHPTAPGPPWAARAGCWGRGTAGTAARGTARPGAPPGPQPVPNPCPARSRPGPGHRRDSSPARDTAKAAARARPGSARPALLKDSEWRSLRNENLTPFLSLVKPSSSKPSYSFSPQNIGCVIQDSSLCVPATCAFPQNYFTARSRLVNSSGGLLRQPNVQAAHLF